MRRLALTALSAGLYAVSFPPWNVRFLAWVALVPLFVALPRLRPLRAAGVGVVWGGLMIWGVGYWVPQALAFYYQQPWWFGVLFALGASIFFAGSYYAAFTACAALVDSRLQGVVRVLLLSTLWVTWEFARARLLTGDPWLLLGYALVGSDTLVQGADVGGVYLLSLLLAFVNASLAELLGLTPFVARSAAVVVAPAVIAVLSAWTYGWIRLHEGLPQFRSVPTVVVQANSDLGAQWREEFYGEGLEQYVRLSIGAVQQRGAELIVWPESAVTFFLAREPRFQGRISRMLEGANAELVLGGPHFEDTDPVQPHFFNSAFHVDSHGHLTGRYDKAHLLPFGEYFPLRTIEFLRRRFERARYFTPGDGATLLQTRFGPVATVICFEGLFPELVRDQMHRGATLLLNLSNDAWLGSSAGAEQHLRMVTLRAVEHHTWLIRATTTGISAVIDPWGRVVTRGELQSAAILRADVVPLHVDTLYQNYGDAVAYICVFVSVAGLAWTLTKPPRPS